MQGLFPPGISDDAVVIGCVGCLEAVKDPVNLVAAVATIGDSNPEIGNRIHLVIAGDGSLKDQIEELAERNGLSDRLRLMGRQNDMPEILAALDVFVSPSFAEGFSNTILEAMACRLSIVATDVGENTRLVEDGKTGRIVPPANPELIGAAIAEYCRTPERIRSDGAEARRRIEREYTIDRMVSDYQSVYDRCLSNFR